VKIPTKQSRGKTKNGIILHKTLTDNNLIKNIEVGMKDVIFNLEVIIKYKYEYESKYN
jgi:hypothetical protein